MHNPKGLLITKTKLKLKMQKQKGKFRIFKFMEVQVEIIEMQEGMTYWLTCFS